MERRLIDNEWLTIDEVYEKYKKLVYQLSHRYVKRANRFGLELEDLVSGGAMGLTSAFKRFNQDFGLKFMTYAHPMIQGAITNLIRDYGPTLKFSRSDQDLAYRIAKEQLVDSDPAELAEIFQVSKHKIQAALAYLFGGGSISMDTITSNDDDKDQTIGELLGQEDDYFSVELSDFLQQLPPREQLIVKARLNDKLQSEIGKAVGVSQVQASRLLKQIKRKYEQYLNGGEEMNVTLINQLIDRHGEDYTACTVVDFIVLTAQNLS